MAASLASSTLAKASRWSRWFLQGDAHRADAPRVLGLAGYQLRGDEVEQLSPGHQVRAGQGEDVVAQPLNERSDVAGEA
jgi:hypothetical protein